MGVSVTDLVPQTNLYQVLSKIINDDPKWRILVVHGVAESDTTE